MRALKILVLSSLLAGHWASADEFPTYKPSSRSAPMDIRSNEYGAHRTAPNALQIGEIAPNLDLPRVGGGVLNTSSVYERGTTVLIFYRGHW